MIHLKGRTGKYRDGYLARQPGIADRGQGGSGAALACQILPALPLSETWPRTFQADLTLSKTSAAKSSATSWAFAWRRSWIAACSAVRIF